MTTCCVPFVTKRSIGEFWLDLHNAAIAPRAGAAAARHDRRLCRCRSLVSNRTLTPCSMNMGKGSIFVHEHDFAAEHVALAANSGRFNVGLVAFRNNAEGRTCLERWKAQCFEECVMDPAAGKCGDQNYLDEWPQLYPGLVISANPGVGLAPWNVAKHQITGERDGILVNGRPVVFYHFHSLSLLRPRLGFWPTVMAYGYIFDQALVSTIYEPYLRELWRIARRLKKLGYGIEGAIPTLPSVYGRARNREIILQIGGYALKIERNVKALELLYGIDSKNETL